MGKQLKDMGKGYENYERRKEKMVKRMLLLKRDNDEEDNEGIGMEEKGQNGFLPCKVRMQSFDSAL